MLLQAKNISKAFRNQMVLNDFSFELSNGEIVVLTGKSGTGKTTLMRILNNLEQTDGGTIAIEAAYLCEGNAQTTTYRSR